MPIAIIVRLWHTPSEALCWPLMAHLLRRLPLPPTLATWPLLARATRCTAASVIGVAMILAPHSTPTARASSSEILPASIMAETRAWLIILHRYRLPLFTSSTSLSV